MTMMDNNDNKNGCFYALKIVGQINWEYYVLEYIDKSF